jgi:hypothetical protein
MLSSDPVVARSQMLGILRKKIKFKMAARSVTSVTGGFKA